MPLPQLPWAICHTAYLAQPLWYAASCWQASTITCGQRSTLKTWSACACGRRACHCHRHHRCCSCLKRMTTQRLRRMRQPQTVSLHSLQGTTQAATWHQPPPETRGKAAGGRDRNISVTNAGAAHNQTHRQEVCQTGTGTLGLGLGPASC